MQLYNIWQTYYWEVHTIIKNKNIYIVNGITLTGEKPTETEFIKQAIGIDQKLKYFREKAGISLETVSQKTGIDNPECRDINIHMKF